MEPRRVRIRSNAKLRAINLITTIVSIAVCSVMVATSIVVWFRMFPQENAREVIAGFQYWYITALGFFLVIASTHRLISSLFKISVRLLFTVWVFGFVAISTMNHGEQVAYNISILFLVGYIEAYFDVHGEIRDISKTIKTSSPFVMALVRHPKVLTVAAIALVHIGIAFMFRDVFEKMFS